MSLQIKKATRLSKKVKIALIGISGSGKTYSALALASALGRRVLLVDTEHGSASAYAGTGPGEFDFSTIELDSFAPQTYVEAIQMAEAENFDVVVLDSLSHAWTGKDGAIEQVDKAQRRSQSSNSFTAWKDVTPQHNAMIEAIVGAKCHIIATMRAKSDYVIEPGKNGKSAPRKVGLAPIQREGLEYEFDLVGQLDQEHFFSISKTRIAALDGAVIEKPGAQLAGVILDWIGTGAPVTQQESPDEAPVAEPVTYEQVADIAALSNADLRTWCDFVAKDARDHPQKADFKAEFKKRQDTRQKPAPPSAIQQKFEEAKAGDPEGEVLFNQESNEPSSAYQEQAITDSQNAAIAAIASRVFGREKRDEQVLALIQDKFGAKSTLETLSASQASQLIAALKAQLETQPEAPAPAPVADKPKGGASLKSLMACVTKAGFSMDEAFKENRIQAVNAWLAGRGNKNADGNPLQITSFSELDTALCFALGEDIKTGVVKWGEEEGVVEGEVSE